MVVVRTKTKQCTIDWEEKWYPEQALIVATAHTAFLSATSPHGLPPLRGQYCSLLLVFAHKRTHSLFFVFFFIISEASGAPSQCCPSFYALYCLKSLPKHKNRGGAGWGRENADGGRRRGRVTRRKRSRRTIILWLQIRSIEILWFWTKLLIF